MTKLEHFKAWAELLFPWIDRTTDETNGKVFFRDKHLQVAWMAFNHAFTVRPTTNTRLNAAEFMKDNPATIVDRLNGIFPTADPPYKMSPLHYEAAREIERLRGDLARPKELNGGKFELVGFRCKDKGASEDYWAYLPMRFFKVEQAPDTDVDLLYVNAEQGS